MGKNKKNIKVESELQQEEKVEFSFKDRSLRFAVDDLFRKYGYEIYKREKGKEPVWKKDGEEYTESEIIYFLDADKLDDAKYAEELYQLGVPSDKGKI